MTEIKNNTPNQDRQQSPVHIRFRNQQAREINFYKPCLDQFIIERRADGGSWEVIAKNVSLPYVDDQTFEAPVDLEYQVKLLHRGGSSDNYLVKASLR